MRHKLLILGTFASLAVTLPLWAAENSGSSVAMAPAALRGKVICPGVQNVPMTADASQDLPMQVVTQLACVEEVAILSNSEDYTVQIRTADGRSGYVSRMYLSEGPAKFAIAELTVEAAVDNGIARWQSGAPGSDQFFSGDSLVESLYCERHYRPGLAAGHRLEAACQLSPSPTAAPSQSTSIPQGSHWTS